MVPDKDKSSATGNKQSEYAGTNPDRYGPPKPDNEQENPVNPGEAQNVTKGQEQLSGKDAEHARNKANERKNHGGMDM
jgi:hypothetical protein